MIVLLILAMLLWPSFAYAQLAVSDAATETSTAHMWGLLDGTNRILGQILSEDTKTAYSLTASGGGGWYQPNARFLQSADNQLFNGKVNAQTFPTYYPGWADRPLAYGDQIGVTLGAYQRVFLVMQYHATELENEQSTIQGIENTNVYDTETNQLLRTNTEALLQVVAQLQLLRQENIAAHTFEIVKAGQELDTVADHQRISSHSILGGGGQ